MNLEEYQKLAENTAKKDFKTKNEEIMCWGLGIAGEAGDVASCIKKTFIHNKEIKSGIRENIGDVLWYCAMICNFFNWNLSEILQENTQKLKKRFPQGFDYNSVKRDSIKWSDIETQ